MKRVKRPAKKAKWRARHTAGVMNGAETRYLQQVLEPLRLAGEVESWKFEKMRFKVGTGGSADDGTGSKAASWLTPDFQVLRADGLIEQVDVKGSGPGEEAAHVRIRAAAELFPEYIWVLAIEVKGRPGRFKRIELDQPV